MKKVILAVLLLAVALFLVLPSLSWAQGTEELYKAKCAGCHGADGKGTAAGKKMGAQEFSSAAVQKMSGRRNRRLHRKRRAAEEGLARFRATRV